QRPDATQVAGFHAWLKLGRCVRKGEKGIVILAPMIRQHPAEDPTEDIRAQILGFRAAHVFDVSQTEGGPLPEFAVVNGDPGHYTQRLTNFVAGKGILLEYSEEIRPAHGMSSGGKI